MVMADLSDYRYISMIVDHCLVNDSVDQAIKLMEHLRRQALRLDRHLADPSHPWNTVYTEWEI